MDKLEPIIRNRFWILSGLVFILALVGWWLASSSLATTIQARTTVIETAEKNIPGAGIPSEDYSRKLGTINGQQEKQVELARTMLWDQQLAKMVWPKNIQPYAEQAGYRGEFAPLARDIYRTSSPSDIARVWQKVRPYNQQNGDGVVVFPLQGMPVKYWQDLPPTSQEMWDAQEDLWLLDSLFSTITYLNGGETSNNRLDASIHQILKLELVGGKRGEPVDAPAADGSGGMGGPGGFGGPGAEGFGGSSGGMGGGRGGKIAVPTTADFPVREEFGSPGGQAGMSGMSDGGFSSGDPSMMGDGQSAENKPRRYIDDEEGAPFKTRGFYMVLLMDHRRIPDLIAELTSNDRSVWPVEIVRVQMVRKNEDAVLRGGAGGMGAPNYGGGGEMGSGFTGASPSFGGGQHFDGMGGGNFGGNVPQDYLSGQNGVNPQDANNPMLQSKIQAANQALQNALTDPNIAEVAIAGYFTLYTSPQPVAAEGETADPAAAATETPAATDPAAVDPAKVDPAAGTPVDPAATPAPGTVPTPGTETPLPDGTVPPAGAGATAPPEGTTPAPMAEGVAPPASPVTPATPPVTPPAAPATPGEPAAGEAPQP